jgi:hypothetical protein
MALMLSSWVELRLQGAWNFESAKYNLRPELFSSGFQTRAFSRAVRAFSPGAADAFAG